MIKRTEILKYAKKEFQAEPEYPFEKFPNYAVLRHGGDDKWFALIVEVPRERLGLDGEGAIDVIDLKCHPEKVEQMKSKKGFLPAYHMNKEHWLTVPLTGAVPLGEIKGLLKESFELTK